MSATTASEATQAAKFLGDYVKSGRSRTDLLKKCAELVVDIRASSLLEDGRVDWAGRSPTYRRTMHEIYTKARVPADKLDTVQQALRYHVGNLLRERADTDALAQVGLTSIAPRARLARTREIVAALAASGSVAEVANDPVRLLVHAEALLEYAHGLGLKGLRGEERVAARLALEEIARRASELRPLVTGQGPKTAQQASAKGV